MLNPRRVVEIKMGNLEFIRPATGSRLRTSVELAFEQGFPVVSHLLFKAQPSLWISDHSGALTTRALGLSTFHSQTHFAIFLRTHSFLFRFLWSHFSASLVLPDHVTAFIRRECLLISVFDVISFLCFPITFLSPCIPVPFLGFQLPSRRPGHLASSILTIRIVHQLH